MTWRSKTAKGGATRDPIETVLGRTSLVRGDLSADGAFRIDGWVEGSVESRAAVVIGESGRPFGANLVAFPCHKSSCPCHPTVKLSPTQRLPSLSNMALPPARNPPPVTFRGRTQALGENLRYGINGTARMVLPCGTG